MTLRTSLLAGFLCLGLLAPAADAHHSFAMFDSSKKLTITGVVEKFEWTNPHCWLHVMVPGANGAPAERWSLEGTSPSVLARRGWKSTDFKVGDSVTVTVTPLRDGTRGGALNTVTRASDGKVFVSYGAFADSSEGGGEAPKE